MKEHTIFEQQCPFCGHRRELRLRRASPRELTRLKSDPDWRKVERMRRAIRHSQHLRI
jgi:hypothetical protein